MSARSTRVPSQERDPATSYFYQFGTYCARNWRRIIALWLVVVAAAAILL